MNWKQYARSYAYPEKDYLKRISIGIQLIDVDYHFWPLIHSMESERHMMCNFSKQHEQEWNEIEQILQTEANLEKMEKEITALNRKYLHQ